jgi:hypothetical protein
VAVERANVERLSEWLADGGSARSSNPAAETLVEKLAALVFQGDSEWPNHADRIDDHRERLGAWFGDDSGHEARFIALTGADSEPGPFIDWFLPVVVGWEGRAAGHAPAGAAAEEAAAAFPNPSYDGTPGTEFYRLDEATREYLYAAGAAGGDWAGYEQRRYSEPARNDGYGLDCRYDRKDQVYEWYDASAATWRDQAWADRHAAGAADPAAEGPAADPAPAWDENWGRFYRVGSDGGYEFADAVVPGERSSGCGGVWLRQDQVLAHETPAAPTADTHAEASADIENAVAAEVAAAVAAIDGAEELTAEELEQIRAELVAEFGAGPTA